MEDYITCRDCGAVYTADQAVMISATDFISEDERMEVGIADDEEFYSCPECGSPYTELS